jgi:site-specific recombinase XerD
VVRLSKQLGHSQLSTTMKYLYLMKEDLQETHRKVSPMSRLR